MSSNELVINAVDGEARIGDLDLAKRIGFSRPAKIRELIGRHRASLEALGVLPTVGTTHEANGRTFNAYMLNRKQAIFITAKSDTPAATDITIEIIEKFDAYERGAVPTIDPMKVLNDPAAMRGLLLTYSEKVLALEETVSQQAPTVAAFDRIANSDGLFNLTASAKILGQPPQAFNQRLHADHWIYKRDANSAWLGYQDKVKSGYIDHKTKTVVRPDGSEKSVSQVFLTPRGIAALARKLGVSPSMEI